MKKYSDKFQRDVILGDKNIINKIVFFGTGWNNKKKGD